MILGSSVQFTHSVMSDAAQQASLSITNSRSPPKLMCTVSVMSSSHLILCRPLLLLPPIPPSIRVFSNESTLRMRWPKYWSFTLSISPSNEHQGLISFIFFFFRFYFIFFLASQYCIGFAIHQHESDMGVHMFLILNPLPPPSLYHLSGSSQCTSPKHPVSCIEPRLVISFLYDIIHVSVPFSQESGLELCFCHLLAGSCWTCHSISLGPSFFT